MTFKSVEDLKAAGFTESGIKRYQDTAQDFCLSIFNRSVALGESDKAADAPREVTHEHVRNAAIQMASIGHNGETPADIAQQVLEFVCVAFVGLGAGKLDKQWGIFLFSLCLAGAVISFVIRKIRRR